MRIVFISGQYPPRTKGGGEISTHLLAQALVARGHEVTVLTEGKSPLDLPLVQGGESVDGVRVVQLPVEMTGKPLFERTYARRMARVILKWLEEDTPSDSPLSKGERVLHAHDFRAALALGEIIRNPTQPPLVRGGVAVATVRDYAQVSGSTNLFLDDGSLPEDPFSWSAYWHDHRVTEVSGVRKLGRFLQYALNTRYRYKMFSRLAGQVFISAAQREVVERLVKPLPTSPYSRGGAVIHNPIQPEFIEKPVVAGEEGRVLYVGRVERYKGVGLLLEAWQEITRQWPQARLTIAGEGAQKQEYEQFAADNGLSSRVSFVGYVPWQEMRKLYDAASIVVAPHLWVEPFGRTVAEGMARGKTVVAANRGGARELVEHGKTGLLFEAGSQDALQETLRQALVMDDGRRQQVGEAARAWVQGHLLPDMIAEQYEQFYRNM